MDKVGPLHRTALHCACAKGNAATTRALLDQGAKPSLEDVEGNTALHLAALSGSVETTTHVRGSPAGPALRKARSKAKRTPRDVAVANKHKDVARLLTDDDELFVAIAMQDETAVADNLKIDNVNSRTEEGFTVLHEAVRVNSVNIAISYGADVNARDNAGITPLLLAAQVGNPSMGDLLMNNRASVTQSDGNGLGPLHHAALKDHGPFCRLLLSREANVNATDKAGEAPVHHAAKAGAASALSELLKRSPLRKENRDGKSPFALARSRAATTSARRCSRTPTSCAAWRRPARRSSCATSSPPARACWARRRTGSRCCTSPPRTRPWRRSPRC